MYCTIVKVVLVLAAASYHCVALPGGAPSRACSDFRPRHVDAANGGFISPQNVDSTPYEIRMSQTNFTRNSVVRGK